MRMWLVNPKLMCRKHLLGEHVEMHMFIGAINKGKNLTGYITTGLVELDRIKSRHDEIVQEMLRRGYNHRTPMKEFRIIVSPARRMCRGMLGRVDREKNLKDLYNRCNDCKERRIK